jgi:transposase
VARDEIRRIKELTRTINQLRRELDQLVRQAAPQLLAERCLGTLIAAKLIGEIAGIDRFARDAQLARMGACAPIPVSTGRSDRHRLDRGGNRQLNHAIHMLAVSKIRHDPQTALYMAKQRANGKSTKEAIRCLKRHLIRRVYYLLRTPNQVPIAIHCPGTPASAGASVPARGGRPPAPTPTEPLTG